MVTQNNHLIRSDGSFCLITLSVLVVREGFYLKMRDGSFEHPKHMFKMVGKNNYDFALKNLHIWTYDYNVHCLPKKLKLLTEINSLVKDSRLNGLSLN